ncbi:MAG: hypothetical protein ACFBWO_02945 [Paracoccaceae bacterium]
MFDDLGNAFGGGLLGGGLLGGGLLGRRENEDNQGSVTTPDRREPDDRFEFGDNPGVGENGGENRDDIYGSTGDDRLNGNGGNDRIYGDDGDDAIDGGAGDDLLVGGEGRDTITTGAGADTVVFGVELQSTNPSIDADAPGTTDTVTDFDAGADVLAFDRDAYGLAGGGRGIPDGERNEPGEGFFFAKIDANEALEQGQRLGSVDVVVLTNTDDDNDASTRFGSQEAREQLAELVGGPGAGEAVFVFRDSETGNVNVNYTGDIGDDSLFGVDLLRIAELDGGDARAQLDDFDAGNFLIDDFDEPRETVPGTGDGEFV